MRLATGHTADGQPTPAWTFERDLEGVGGVRATLDDMVAYVQAHLGMRPSRLDAALALSRQPIDVPGEQPMAMCWLLAPLDGRTLHLYEGTTGGFSSFVGIDGERGRGVVVLSDTEQLSLGGLGKFDLHLIDARLGAARPSLPRR
ncbi:MAG: serine hydrolase [Byssovorax sp.]